MGKVIEVGMNLDREKAIEMILRYGSVEHYEQNIDCYEFINSNIDYEFEEFEQENLLRYSPQLVYMTSNMIDVGVRKS